MQGVIPNSQSPDRRETVTVMTRRLDNRATARWGYSMVELMIATAVIAAALMTLMSIIGMSFRLATQSRQRSYAYLVGNSTLEKIRAHRYGESEPAYWKNPEYSRVTVEGTATPLTTEFRKEITYENGSFVGNGAGNSDAITIKITWVEGTGKGGAGVQKELTMKTEVRRDVPE